MSTLTVSKKVSVEAESYIPRNVAISVTPQYCLVQWCRAGRLLTIKLIFTSLLLLNHVLSSLVLLQTVTAQKKTSNHSHRWTDFYPLSIFWHSKRLHGGIMVSTVSSEHTLVRKVCRISTLFLGSVWVCSGFPVQTIGKCQHSLT